MNSKIKWTLRGAGVVALGVALTVVLAACTGNGKTAKAASSLQKSQQAVTNTYEQTLTNAEPYPLSKVTDSDERANLIERLTRTNNPNKIGYLYILNNLGTPIGYYTVKGKVSSTNSQLTNDQQVVNCGGGDDGDPGSCVVNAMGDDGSYGSEEGGDRGIFFFTTSDVMVETDSDFIYADAPLTLNVPLLITDDATPTTKTR